MLWEVTDGDIDKMTTEFMSKWIMSTAKRAWSDVDQSSWFSGVIGKFRFLLPSIIRNFYSKTRFCSISFKLIENQINYLYVNQC